MGYTIDNKGVSNEGTNMVLEACSFSTTKENLTMTTQNNDKYVIDGKEVDLKSCDVQDVKTWDYPDFSDANIYYAQFTDGTQLNDAQLDELNDLAASDGFIHELAFESCL